MKSIVLEPSSKKELLGWWVRQQVCNHLINQALLWNLAQAGSAPLDGWGDGIDIAHSTVTSPYLHNLQVKSY